MLPRYRCISASSSAIQSLQLLGRKRPRRWQLAGLGAQACGEKQLQLLLIPIRQRVGGSFDFSDCWKSILELNDGKRNRGKLGMVRANENGSGVRFRDAPHGGGIQDVTICRQRAGLDVFTSNGCYRSAALTAAE